MNTAWIQTYTGVKFDLLEPTPDMVRIEDIAHALANICRFGGHVRRFYSVAQHSVHVSLLASRYTSTEMSASRLQMVALLHDATEAYVGDMVRPLKCLIPDYRAIERNIWRAIVEKIMRLSYEIPGVVKHLDNVALMTERRDLLGTPPDAWSCGLEEIQPDDETIIPFSPEAAERLFLLRFEELSP